MLPFNKQEYYSNIPLLEEHAKENCTDSNSKNCLVLVHPYFCKLNGEYMSKVDEFETYSANLDKIYNSKRKNLSIVLYEEPSHYAKLTSELVEKHFFDKVIFTNGSCGDPYKKQELNYFSNKNIFVGGMYNGLCLSNAISEIKENTTARKIVPIKQISLNTWARMREQYTIFPNKVVFLTNSQMPLKTRNLDDFFNKFFE